ncbi:hypothetical protein M9H77_04696 [Catharanthus roseus]|uniref:Uncharacterized protein n=1 Tax=Catharanthus roseus TaxID=4058 RepID=A0ACC0CES7_CATRO|nr:hypothetical protein M9H77_04696 [Catharanthus roseus]
MSSSIDGAVEDPLTLKNDDDGSESVAGGSGGEDLPTMKNNEDSCKENLLTLKSNDGQEFTVKESIAIQSVMIKNMVEDGCSSGTIPVNNFDGKILALVIECMNNQGDPRVSKEDKEKFNSEFVKREDGMLYYLLSAAHYLEIKDMIGLLSQSIADKIKGMEVVECRKFFNIENDFTPEEEEAIRKEHEWAHSID